MRTAFQLTRIPPVLPAADYGPASVYLGLNPFRLLSSNAFQATRDTRSTGGRLVSASVYLGMFLSTSY